MLLLMIWIGLAIAVLVILASYGADAIIKARKEKDAGS